MQPTPGLSDIPPALVLMRDDGENRSRFQVFGLGWPTYVEPTAEIRHTTSLPVLWDVCSRRSRVKRIRNGEMNTISVWCEYTPPYQVGSGRRTAWLVSVDARNRFIVLYQLQGCTLRRLVSLARPWRLTEPEIAQKPISTALQSAVWLPYLSLIHI